MLNDRTGALLRARWPVLLCMGWVACGSPHTTVLIEASFPAEQELDQLRLSGSVPERLLFGPVLRPEVPDGLLVSPQTVRVVLDDADADQVMEVTIEGMRGDARVLSGTGSTTSTRKVETLLRVSLVSPDVCASCAPGTTCVEGACRCTAGSCTGCCEEDTCQTRSLSSCGAPGATCVTCGELLADNCSASGACSCGLGAACQPGQRCLSGNCVCDSTSCASGCCSLNTCKTPALGQCGLNGQACVACNFVKADGCLPSGSCGCGINAACGTGLKCVSGSCVCHADTCPNGCCTGNECKAGTGNTECGTGGVACQNCTTTGTPQCGGSQVCQ